MRSIGLVDWLWLGPTGHGVAGVESDVVPATPSSTTSSSGSEQALVRGRFELYVGSGSTYHLH